LIRSSKNIDIQDSIFFNSQKHSVVITDSSDLGDTSAIIFQNNFIVHNAQRDLNSGEAVVDFTSALYADISLSSSSISGNIVAGCEQECITAIASACGSTENVLSNNVAHSGKYGWLVTTLGQQCI